MSSTALSKLEKLEATIQSGLETFLDVGNSLRQIRDERLYRDGYETFEEYVFERWGWKKAHAYRMIQAAQVDENLSPIGDAAKPKSESQYREVAKAPAEKQAKVVETASRKAAEEDRQPTAKDYAEARKEVCKEPEYVDADDSEEDEVAYDESAVKAYRKCGCRLATLRQILLVECSETELAIVKEWLAS